MVKTSQKSPPFRPGYRLPYNPFPVPVAETEQRIADDTERRKRIAEAHAAMWGRR